MEPLYIHSDRFDMLRDGGGFYVDKTLLIKDILERDEWGRFLYTRPHGFGKTLNLSMLDCFFNIDYKGNDWFDGLRISEYHQFDVHRNRYPVIRLDMMTVVSDNVSEYKGLIRSMVTRLFMRFAFLLEDERLDSIDRQFMMTVLSGDLKVDWINEAVPGLMRILRNHYGEPVVVLIDEYDRGLRRSYSSKCLDMMAIVLAGFLGSIIKKSPDAKFVYVTGITPLIRSGDYPQINNVLVDSMFYDRACDRFGFTEDEVRDILEGAGCGDDLEKVLGYYGGYVIGCHRICNPNNVIRYVSRGKLESTLPGSTSFNPIKNTLDLMDNAMFASFFPLLNSGTIRYPLDDGFRYRDIDVPEFQRLLTPMVMTGQLTATSADEGYYDIAIPNEEVLQYVRRRLGADLPLTETMTGEFAHVFETTDAEGMERILEHILFGQSLFEPRGEWSYAILLLQLLSAMISRFDADVHVEADT
ncbi:MAG: AAA family ATPase, partial [Candidatus Methanomethylophilaceae archaeon]